MSASDRKGKENVAEIVPFCSGCGECLDVDHDIARRLTQHESITVPCEHCGHVMRLETEIVYFSKNAAQTQQDSTSNE